jgi:hypothetical protein
VVRELKKVRLRLLTVNFAICILPLLIMGCNSSDRDSDLKSKCKKKAAKSAFFSPLGPLARTTACNTTTDAVEKNRCINSSFEMFLVIYYENSLECHSSIVEDIFK